MFKIKQFRHHTVKKRGNLHQMKRKILTLILTLTIISANAQNLDTRILRDINLPFHAGPDKAWRFISNASIPIDFAVPVSILIVGLSRQDQALEVKAIETGSSLFISAGSGFLLKEIIRRQRPFLAYPSLIYKKQNESGYSFPSNHASMAFSTATSLSLALPKWYVIAPAFAFATATGYSRLYLGVHYPSDVLAGALIGVGSSFITWELQRILNRKSLHHWKF